METETQTVDVRVRPSGEFRIDTPCGVAYVTRDQLATIVQQAYDVHGILAAPSYGLEAERPTGCQCGTAGCSGTGLQVGAL